MSENRVRLGLRLPVPLAERRQQISEATGVSVPGLRTVLSAICLLMHGRWGCPGCRRWTRWWRMARFLRSYTRLATR